MAGGRLRLRRNAARAKHSRERAADPMAMPVTQRSPSPQIS
jgi:hypothetical protein